jgi:intergrase/recombinase
VVKKFIALFSVLLLSGCDLYIPIEQMSYSEENWEKHPDLRAIMIEELYKIQSFNGLKEEEIKDMFGKPSVIDKNVEDGMFIYSYHFDYDKKGRRFSKTLSFQFDKGGIVIADGLGHIDQ